MSDSLLWFGIIDKPHNFQGHVNAGGTIMGLSVQQTYRLCLDGSYQFTWHSEVTSLVY